MQMPGDDQPKPECLVLVPSFPGFRPVRDAIFAAVQAAGFRRVFFGQQLIATSPIAEEALTRLVRAECVVANITGLHPEVMFILGQAQAMGKPTILVRKHEEPDDVPSFPFLEDMDHVTYAATPGGVEEFVPILRHTLEQSRASAPRARRPWQRISMPFSIDWDRLDVSDAENLCQELLTQMGFRSVDWYKESPEFDIIAELPKKDPDGFEYRELWLVAMGRHTPLEMILEMASHDPEMFLRHLSMPGESVERLISQSGTDVPLTLLVIDHRSRVSELKRMVRRRLERRRGASTIRIRVWDRKYLTSLVQQFPQIGYKYFSDEGRSQSKYRKTPDELYRENVEFATKQAALIGRLEDEKNRRVSAERDAVWKDIAFSAAHKMGNPIFAIETNLDPLRKRIEEDRSSEAVVVVRSIRASVDKAKDIVDQFKSLTRAQQITLEPTLLRPVLVDACKPPQNQGVECKIECAEDILVQADPLKLAETFDELAANAMHWFDKEKRLIDVQVNRPKSAALPDGLDSEHAYVLIRFRDNGCGLAVKEKDRIFDAFVSSRDHGTGLGLALVRRIIEGHGGAITETGIPGKGAEFEVYLPLAAEKKLARASKRKKKRKAAREQD
jgi:signal transduction histidine kinase